MNQSKKNPQADSQAGKKDPLQQRSSEQQGGAKVNQGEGTDQQEQGSARTGQGGQGGQQKQGVRSGQQGGPVDPGPGDEDANRTGLSRPAGGSPNTPRQ